MEYQSSTLDRVVNFFGENPRYIIWGFFILMAVFVRRFFKEKRNLDYNSYTPDAIATLGIIGTFLGITLGLLRFDTSPEKLNQSIPTLLEGMKIAFITSLLGLGISLWLKGKQSTAIKNLNKKSTEELLEELLEVVKNSDNSTIQATMLELKDSTTSSNNIMVECVKELKNNIGTIFSSGENSLMEQMKQLREGMLESQAKSQESLDKGLGLMTEKLDDLVKENKDISKETKRGNDQLIENFVSFREDMAKAFTEEFTQALTKSIQDLNNQLQEQLGENFKNAVNKLVDWQEHYIETIKNTTSLLETTSNSIKGIEGSFGSIADKADSLLRVSEELKPTIIGLNKQQKDLSSGLENFSKTSDNFKEKVDLILENTTKLQENIEENSETLFNKLNHTVEKFNDLSDITDSSIEEFRAYAREIADSLNNEILELDKNIEEIIKNSINKMQNQSELMTNVAQAQVNNMEYVNKNIAKSYGDSIDSLSENLKITFENSNQAMLTSISNLEKTMEDSLVNFASMLTKVSETFVEDYKPLTKKLKDLIELANRLDKEQ